MKRLLLLLVLLLVLVACAPPPAELPAVVTLTSSATPAASPTVTSEISATDTATPVLTSTPPPTATTRPTATPAPTSTGAPSPTAAVSEEVEGFCPEVNRPALLLHANWHWLADPDGGEPCRLDFPDELVDNPQLRGDYLYYHVDDVARDTIVVKRAPSGGPGEALEFTRATGLHSQGRFIVSVDGQRLAWSDVQPDDAFPGAYASSVYVANVDGSDLRTLLDGHVDDQGRIAEPVSFSADGETLFMALQMYGIGGHWLGFHALYDSLWALPLDGGEPLAIYECRDHGLSICIGDWTADGQLLAVVDQGAAEIRIVSADGSVVASVTPAETEFIGYPAFAPDGTVAIYSTTVAEHPDGYGVPGAATIELLAPPYDGPAQIVVSGEHLWPFLRWFDNERLLVSNRKEIYSAFSAGQIDVVHRSGEWVEVEPEPARFISIAR